ncbi:MAG TPA: alpha/beta fold hydrolase [Gammaproteobacteria bacterium]|nr:alpha/beta fold hydrolase [Gammaproteobacteria bacterium]
MAIRSPTRRHGLLLALIWIIAGCAPLHVRDAGHGHVAGATRGDVLSDGKLSAATHATLLEIALDADGCFRRPRSCEAALASSRDLATEDRLAALAELELAAALAAERPSGQAGAANDNARRAVGTASSDALEAYAEAARASYAYLFFTHDPGERAFQDRQVQVRYFYNHACERFAELLFAQLHANATPGAPRPSASEPAELAAGAWRVQRGNFELRFPQGGSSASELVAVSRLELEGIRTTYGRDGFGAAFVAIGAAPQRTGARLAAVVPTALHAAAAPSPLVEARYLPATVVVRFPGDTLAEVLATHTAIVDVDDPYATAAITIGAHSAPLVANFTAPYALWLAEGRFERQAGLTLLRPVAGLHAPRLYMLQPYDPNRRTVVLLHGLGSSPDAWLNLANELLGDPALRARYQLWQIFYPTNLPIPENRRAIRAAISDAFAALDPAGEARASRGVTLIGHSMGGVIARLLLVESGDALWQDVFAKPSDPALRERYAVLAPYLDLEPLPQVDEAIFLAAPHRGAPMARDLRGRVAALAVRLPVEVVDTLTTVADALGQDLPLRAAALRKRRNSITTLSDRDDYLHATAALAIAPGVVYHSIVGRRDDDVPLADSSDGVVPYASSHLDGAASELVVRSGHSVQDTPQAILEIRRILRDKKGI